jgi:hypothetical protein
MVGVVTRLIASGWLCSVVCVSIVVSAQANSLSKLLAALPALSTYCVMLGTGLFLLAPLAVWHDFPGIYANVAAAKARGYNCFTQSDTSYDGDLILAGMSPSLVTLVIVLLYLALRMIGFRTRARYGVAAIIVLSFVATGHFTQLANQLRALPSNVSKCGG